MADLEQLSYKELQARCKEARVSAKGCAHVVCQPSACPSGANKVKRSNESLHACRKHTELLSRLQAHESAALRSGKSASFVRQLVQAMPDVQNSSGSPRVRVSNVRLPAYQA
jgi:hypothetical protein